MNQQTVPTQSLVEIKKIKNGVVYLKNGGLRKVLMVSGINFDLKPEEEQNIIIYSFQNFLNVLDFPAQIVIHSRKLNIESYLKRLEEREKQEENELLKNQIIEYKNFINDFVKENAIVRKTFFIIVPYDPISIPTSSSIFSFFKKNKKNEKKEEDKGEAHNLLQLDQRTNTVIDHLTQIGLRVVPLNDSELMEIFYNLYNPQTIEKKHFK